MKGKKYSDGIVLNGECIEAMNNLIENNMLVDCVIADIPYGTTACAWDDVIPFAEMWECLNKVVKSDNSPILLFGAEPFTSRLICSNINNFKYKWYYKKLVASNFASAKYQPMKHIEDICVFTRSGKTACYYPIKEARKGSGSQRLKAGYKSNPVTGEFNGKIKSNRTEVEYDELKFPENIREFNNRAAGQRGLHPTQKPIELMEYLVKSHTKEGETVLDFTAGSGTTLLACRNLGRKFIGIEKEEKYYTVIKKRLEEKDEDTIQAK